jgi:hypothetical protein
MISPKALKSMISNPPKNMKHIKLKTPKASISDLKILIRCYILKDYEDAIKTKLYKKLGSEYCRYLELMNYINTVNMH